MAIISPGVQGAASRGRPSRLPPGQYVTHEFPVLSAGPTGFVEATADYLVDLGDHAESIRTERFGPTG